MRILTGEMTGKNVARLQASGFGRMRISRNWQPFTGEPWALDNGAYRMFSAAKKAAGFGRSEEVAFIMAGQPGVVYDWTEFEKRLLEASELAYRKGSAPLFVVVPDLVAKGRESLAFSLEWIQNYEARNESIDPYAWYYGGRFGALPLYLAVQDGMTPAMLESIEDPETGELLEQKIAGLFLGGSVAFKESTAKAWREWTRARGLKLHYGRAGTPRKVQLAYDVGADSADSAAFLWSKEKWTAFEAAVRVLGSQFTFDMEAA